MKVQEMAVAAGTVNIEQFDKYFQLADLDRDGLISGAEARDFLHGSNLPHPVLSQIWTYVNQNKTEYLTRLEFHNALKLVTVAQSKRELTPDIVTAALYGPASTMIPPPKIDSAQPSMVLPGLPTHVSPSDYGLMNSQFGSAHSATVLPSFVGTDQRFRQAQPISTGMNQQVNSSVSSLSTFAHTSWPKMTSASVQSYAKVFMHMGKDRDGKITSMEARNLFLSWGLPMELLKQVWDLSDQDKDGMLCLREFCIALYLTEQYRGERQLPSMLPKSVMLDETLSSLVGPPAAYGNVGWAPTTGVTPAGLKSPIQHYSLGNSRAYKFSDEKYSADTKVHKLSKINKKHFGILGGYFIYGLCATLTLLMIINTVNDQLKIENYEKMLIESTEKLEFCRATVQDLVLLKSRCDNQLNEITERVRADKAEAESLEKKCQENINIDHQEVFSCDIAVPANLNSQREHSPDKVLNTDVMSEKRCNTDEPCDMVPAESMYSADEPKIPRVTYESATRDYTNNHFTKNSNGNDVTQRNFDEPAWDSFSNNEDNDSVWGFNAKDSENGKSDTFHRPFTFEESVCYL